MKTSTLAPQSHSHDFSISTSPAFGAIRSMLFINLGAIIKNAPDPFSIAQKEVNQTVIAVKQSAIINRG